MKVLMINKFLYPNGGSETYIFELGKQLEKMGHEVQYFGMEHEGRCVGNRVGAYTSGMVSTAEAGWRSLHTRSRPFIPPRPGRSCGWCWMIFDRMLSISIISTIS